MSWTSHAGSCRRAGETISAGEAKLILDAPPGADSYPA